MSERILYCPRCGRIQTVFDNDEYYCLTCKKQIMIDTKHNDDYFREKYYNKVGTTPETIININFKELVRQEFVYNNPLYNKEDVKKRKEFEKRCDKKAQQENLKSKYIPKCPTCGSTNVEKISGASKVGKAALFGVFSVGTLTKTYCCKNCGYKW